MQTRMDYMLSSKTKVLQEISVGGNLQESRISVPLKLVKWTFYTQDTGYYC